ncbi:MAG TPA: DUF6498-containing protein [Gemmatimonadales bacterium]|nr:DUF6498-containing protein [Gemmatimonadales bacterium]
MIVGGFNVLRMLWAQPDNPLMWVAKAGMIPFFVVHYVIFTTVHGVFVLTLFSGVHGAARRDPGGRFSRPGAGGATRRCSSS